MKDLMIDIETLSTKSNAVITQIGACYFDRYTGEIGKKFLMNIDLKSYDNNKDFDISGSTLKWWFKQENLSWLDEFNIKTRELEEVLNEFNNFVKEAQTIWCHAIFDEPIIRNAIEHFDIKPNWHYVDIRDIRTLSDLANIKIFKTKTKKTHNALDDCLYQVKYCKDYFNKLKK